MGFNKPGGRGGSGGGGKSRGSRGDKFQRDLAKINSRIQKAFTQIAQVTDNAVAEFTKDVARMANQIIKDEIKDQERSTGELASTIAPLRNGELSYSVGTHAKNQDGYGYGAAQEWGWHPRKGRKKKIKGKHSIVRATFGMVKRWQRGERWRD